ncbi:MAG: T9SS type A sorting domain-containing protein [Saprospiraceae bacterium]|nr:T9SS type A sorting domain-containing protein [Saprospiraceae bacterium]
MKFSFTKLMTAFAAVMLLSFQVSAQTVIWSEDFGGGAIPATWTNVDATNQVTTLWQYSTAGPYFGGQPAFASPTAANGFVIFNSDAAGPVNPSHDLRLTTNVINVTGNAMVVAKFSNQYAYYSTGGVSIPELGVSTDGGVTFTYFPILATIAQNDLSIAETVEEVDITAAVAANPANVQLQFRWRGNYEYTWRIDDIIVQDGFTPLPADNIAIANDFYAIASSYQMPVDQVDSIRFLADIANIGSNVQTNVTMTVTVVKDSDNSTVYTDSHNYGTLQPGDTVENYLFTQTYYPPATPESYTATYTLSSDATDVEPSNNTATFAFEIIDNIFSKVATPTTSIAPSASNSWTAGTHYYAYKGTEISGLDTTARYATAITFGISNATGAQSIAGQNVDVFLETGIDTDGSGLIEPSERTVVAFGSHTFTAADDDIIICLFLLINFTGSTPLYELEDNANYLVSVKYTATGTEDMFLLMSDAENYAGADFAAGLSGTQRYGHFLDIGNSGDYNYITNFGGNPTPAIGLLTSSVFTTSTADAQLEANALTIFPNPASEFVTATLNLEEVSETARITIYNVQGQVMETRNLSNVRNEQVEFNLDAYSSGTYLMSIDTDSGHTIKRFIVKK